MARTNIVTQESIRKKKTDLLLEELVFCELDEIAKVVATQIPTKMLLRIINKFRRLRGESTQFTTIMKS